MGDKGAEAFDQLQVLPPDKNKRSLLEIGKTLYKDKAVLIKMGIVGELLNIFANNRAQKAFFAWIGATVYKDFLEFARKSRSACKIHVGKSSEPL
jgi:hypothetical protein